MRPTRARIPAALLASAAALPLGLGAISAAAQEGPLLARAARPAWAQLEEAGRGALSAALPTPERLAVARSTWRLLEARLLSLGVLPVEVALRARDALRRAEAPQPSASWLLSSSRGSGPEAQPVVRAAVRGAHTRSITPAWAGVHVWAEGAGYAVGRRSAGYGLEGGAALPLDEHVDLTAGYRLAGYTLGERLDPELSNVDDRIATPFVGLDFRF